MQLKDCPESVIIGTVGLDAKLLNEIHVTVTYPFVIGIIEILVQRYDTVLAISSLVGGVASVWQGLQRTQMAVLDRRLIESRDRGSGTAGAKGFCAVWVV